VIVRTPGGKRKGKKKYIGGTEYPSPLKTEYREEMFCGGLLKDEKNTIFKERASQKVKIEETRNGKKKKKREKEKRKILE